MAIRNIPLSLLDIPTSASYFPDIRIGQEIPQSYIRLSTSIDLSTAAVNSVIARSTPVPPGFNGIVRDISVVFSGGTSSGKIAFVILDDQGNLVTTITASIASNAAGLSAVVLPGQRIGFIVESQGAGILTNIDCSGVWTYIGDLV